MKKLLKILSQIPFVVFSLMVFLFLLGFFVIGPLCKYAVLSVRETNHVEKTSLFVTAIDFDNKVVYLRLGEQTAILIRVPEFGNKLKRLQVGDEIKVMLSANITDQQIRCALAWKMGVPYDDY